ncbi:MAG TPA: hypothetical protein DEP69_07275, partial [Acidimicrobiaceae bacterium]|nr:hypothetical protein [Acidimicrobiaceae bacterium]
LADGSTIAELAEANGATAQDAVDAIVAEAAARVAEHGKDVDHDELVAKVTARVNGEAGEFEGKRGYRGFHDKRGFGCADDDAADADADDGAAAAAAV